MQRLDKNKLRAHKPYRHAVVEAMRVAIAAGESFPEAVNVVINSYEECAQSLAREDVCSICRGSELSGDALLCDNCNVAETHLHCLTPQIIDPPEGNWYCGDCCELKHLPRHYMPPQVIVQAEEEPPPEPSPDPVGHASSRKSKHAPSLASAPVDEISSGKRSKRVGGSESASFRREGASVLESLQRLVATVAPTDASDSDGDLQDVQATPYTSVLGKTKGVYNGTIRPSIGSYISDICAVCELGGTLMLCDYPGCRRSFHHVSNAFILFILYLLICSAIFSDVHPQKNYFQCI